MTGNRMRQRLAAGGDAPGAQYEVDLKLSGRKEGEEGPGYLRQRHLDEHLGRMIREMGRRQAGQLTVNWGHAQASCTVITVDGSRGGYADATTDRPHNALRAALADLLDPLEVAG